MKPRCPNPAKNMKWLRGKPGEGKGLESLWPLEGLRGSNPLLGVLNIYVYSSNAFD